MIKLCASLTLMHILWSAVSYGQTAPRKLDEIEALSDSISKFHTEQIKELNDDRADTLKGKSAPFFSKTAFARFFDEYFTLVNYQRQSFPEGNSAGLVIAENNTKLNLTLSKKINSSILSLGTALNIKDQSGTLFSGDRPTAGTQINLNYSILLPGQHFFYDPNERSRNYENREKVLDSLKTLYTIRNPANYKIVEAKLRKSDQFIKSAPDSIQLLEASVRKWSNKIDSLKKTIPPIDSAKLKEYIGKQRNSQEAMDNFSEKLVKEIDNSEKLKKDISGMELSKPVEEAYADIKKSAQDVMIKKQFQNKAINSLWFQWLSGGVSYKRELYDTYDSTHAFNSRIDDRSFNVWTLALSYNFFKIRTARYFETYNGALNSIYFGLNYSLASANNYADITASDVTVQTVSTSNDSVYVFASSKKLRDVTNKEFDSFLIHKFGIQFTGMFGKKEFVGINLNGYLESEKSITTSNLRAGLLFKFKDSDEKKAFINFEVFLSLKDLDSQKDANKNKNTWQRKEIGVSTVIPFEKVFFR